MHCDISARAEHALIRPRASSKHVSGIPVFSGIYNPGNSGMVGKYVKKPSLKPVYNINYALRMYDHCALMVMKACLFVSMQTVHAHSL